MVDTSVMSIPAADGPGQLPPARSVTIPGGARFTSGPFKGLALSDSCATWLHRTCELPECDCSCHGSGLTVGAAT
jgi:hypothetical protein